MIAYSAIRQGPLYRSEAFRAGLEALGYQVRDGYPTGACDLLVIWNRYGISHAHACQAENKGVQVIMTKVVVTGGSGFLGSHIANTLTEKGYEVTIFDRRPSPYITADQQMIAVALGGHNGQGTWPAGDGSRWAKLGIMLKPMKTSGDYILVCPNRSFGVPGKIMPIDWASKTAGLVKIRTGSPVVVRGHPGNDKPNRPLSEDLVGAKAMVIWYSSAGVHALTEGVPVICMAPTWICKDAAMRELSDVWSQADWYAKRLASLERMAWAQWSLAEIATGEPFKRLLS